MGKQIGRWRLKHTLGHGSFGEVKLVSAADTGEQAACKLCAKQALCKGPGRTMLQREIAVQKALRHPNVLQLKDVLETAKHFYIIIELATGGELFDLIQDHKRFDESTARSFFHQLILGVRYCHQQGVVHRDLKPQNLLLTHESTLKIADFGFSNFQQIDQDGKVTQTMRLQTCCGTPNYAAPEIFLGKGYSGFCTDVWSCGVILYVMMVGHVPFRSDGRVKGLQGVIIAICEGRYSIPAALSDGARDLIRSILNNDPEQRMPIEGIIAHSWFAEGFDYSQVLAAAPKMSVSDAMIRESIRPAQESDDGDEPDMPRADTAHVAWGTGDGPPGVLDALSDCPEDERIASDSRAEISEDLMEVLPEETEPELVRSFDEHGRTRVSCMRGGHDVHPPAAARVRFEAEEAPQAAAAAAAEVKTPHAFSKVILPCLCFYCGKFIYGQGMKCGKCACPVHVKCVESAKEYTHCEQYANRAKGGL
eukprot:TRINITY_DN40205_c0_g1_i1.p1 TRINITY_DN40205_c0_g1~~TRINITY_DN40205_c0_g1_i1.p1  ORF type:complete len:478 (+),score=114.12 TRINITY_DN40205_c0_g1_i1:63-1496(+)